MAPSQLSNKILVGISKALRDRVHTKEEIVDKLYYGLKSAFGFSAISIYFVDPVSYDISFVCSPQKEAWALPVSEKKWVLDHIKAQLQQHPSELAGVFYEAYREKAGFVDKAQLVRDQKLFGYACSDALYVALSTEEEVTLGLIVIHNWEQQTPLFGQDYEPSLKEIAYFVRDITQALDNFFIHQKIEGLLSDKKHLKQRIQKDEEDLKRRLLELSVLYDASNALGHSLNYYQMVQLVMEALYKVLQFDVCSIFLLDFVPGGEIMTRVNSASAAGFVENVQSNIVAVTVPFVRKQLDLMKVKITTENRFNTLIDPPKDSRLKSFSNVPLIFKEDVIGMLNVCSTLENVFGRNEMTFLHTMANQLASHLGRLKTVKRLEKSKIGSLIFGMTEGVVMFGEENELELINPPAISLLGFDIAKKVTTDMVLSRFSEMGVDVLFQQALESGKPFVNQEVTLEEKTLLVNITMVKDNDFHRVGTVLVFRDFTELQRINKVKTQRLEMISRLNLIIKSITDLESLLTVIMEFILTVASAEMGSIQLKKGKGFYTKVHSNFPDKIRRNYKFKSGETISEYVGRTRSLCFIDHYGQNPQVNGQVKILLDAYLGIPIMIKQNIIGILNVARKTDSGNARLTQDDIDTLLTITELMGTAIHNGILYQETLEKQKLDQELRIANDIQKKLLPEKLPQLEGVSLGAISVPAREIGGDYYDFFELDNGHIGIVLADIVGKGVPAGLFMAMLKSILHTHLLSETSPCDALEKINALLYKDPVINKFIPLFYAIFDPKTLSLRYCNAGHEPAILFSKRGLQDLDTRGYPLGSFPESDYEEKEVILSDQDVLLCFTDGVVESRNNKGKNFGRKHLEQIVKKYSHLQAVELVRKVYGHIQRTSDSSHQHDDLTLVCLKVELSKAKEGGKNPPLEVLRYKVSSSRKNVKYIRERVDEITKKMGFSSEVIFDIKLAVNEAQANVIEHAYFGKEDGEIVVQFFIYADRLEIMMKDFGPGMDQRTIKGEEHLEEIEGSGLGVFLMKANMDSVAYKKLSKIGNELWMTKYTK